jgi:hypothetical protein
VTRDYSQEGDPYGISEYTGQSPVPPTEKKVRPDGDVRGNSVCKPRGVPTQEECDAIKKEQ